VFTLHQPKCEIIHAVVPAARKTYKLQLHSPLLLQLRGWIPICLPAFTVSWHELKMMGTTQHSSIDEPDETQPAISPGSLQSACHLPTSFVRSFFRFRI
jgi:hypothetical protein